MCVYIYVFVCSLDRPMLQGVIMFPSRVIICLTKNTSAKQKKLLFELLARRGLETPKTI